MQRRTFVTQGLAAGAVAWMPAVRHTARHTAAAPPVLVQVDATRPGIAIPPDFMGLGYEISSVAQPGLLSAANQHYVALVRTLGHAGVVRVGGNTADFARYAGGAPAVSAPKATVVNDASLRDLGGFLRATGWTLIWGLNLGNGSIGNAIAEAGAVQRAVGDHLVAFEIGNEPDLFPDSGHRRRPYSYVQWLTEYQQCKSSLRERFPHLPLAGPDVDVQTDWVSRFATDEGTDIKLLTHHYYREGQNPSSTAEKLLGDDPKLQPELDRLRAASAEARVPYRICEVNSFSGGGRPGVSDTFAGALWALDFMHRLAASGCAGVNMETGVNQLGFVSSYSPIGDDGHGNYTAESEYYGMLAFALGAQGRVLPVQVATPGATQGRTQGATPGVRGYATLRADGRVAVTLVNPGADSVHIRLQMDGKAAGADVEVTRLTAPGIAAKDGVTLGGAAVAEDGTWAPAPRKIGRGARRGLGNALGNASGSGLVRDGGVVLGLPGWSAAVLVV